mgnify:FL=1
MKIGIYGGSFNPIHFGHIGLAKWVTEHTDLDQVWLMVSPNNPLKDKAILADEQERLDAAKEAIRKTENEKRKTENGKQILVSDFEFHLPRPNYTANTLRELQKQYPQHEFTLIIGEDNLNIFNKWREYQYILDTYRIFVYPRRNIISQTSQQHEDILRKANNVKLLADAPYFDISSTELRKNLHN